MRLFGFLGLTSALLAMACVAHEQAYEIDAQGHPAVIDEKTTIRWPLGVPSGLILATEVCDDRAYMLVTRQRLIRVADLAAGTVTGQIGRPGEGPGELRLPTGILADCARGRLYVAENPSGITVYRLPDGRYLRKHSQPAAFGLTVRSPMFLSSDGSRLFAGGLWAESGEQQMGLNSRPQEEVLAGMQLGLSLSLADGAPTPLFSRPIETACIGMPEHCRNVTLTRVDGASDPWVVAQAAATSLGVYGEDGALVRTIDVRSPQFLRDGSRATRMRRDGQGMEAMVNWGLTNSTIERVYAFRDVIATLHRRHATEYGELGSLLQYHVFMNLHSHDGDGLVSDIRLPGLPVGRDDTHLLFIDWGAAGRRYAFDQVDLVRVPVLAGDGGFVRKE